MKNIVILQPHYLPWIGFFEQIILSDVFVFYDDVQFPQGRSFTSRVQVKTEQGNIRWLSVPIKHNGIRNINEILIDTSQDWKKKHLEFLNYNYRRARFFIELRELLNEIFSIETKYLCEFNISAIKIICKYLGIESDFYCSSELGVRGKSSERLLEIVKRFEGTQYITGHGALNYLKYDLFEKNQIRVSIMKYNCNEFLQLAGEFTPYISIIDGIANEGRNLVRLMDSQAVYWRDYINE